jgi:hypothetical protein
VRSRLVLVALVMACASPPAAPLAPPPFDAASAERDVRGALDDFHDAAAHADEARYFSHFTSDGVFLGTDATERWDVPAFRSYAHPHFASGKGWVFHPLDRNVTFSKDGSVAWFDEHLRGDKLGPTRGSGVLVRQNGRYLIAQYNLTFTIPNDKFDAVHTLLEPPPGAELRARYKVAYDRATEAASKGDLVTAHDALAALVPEAKPHHDDDLEFWLHNELTWIAWARGESATANDEVDAAGAALDQSSLPPDKVRSLRLHELWDRAYLLMEKARVTASIASAEQARARYEELAKVAGDHDGMAVLEAFFATQKGDGKGALAASRRVDVEKDSDLQDLYVIASALDLGGDHEGARKTRERICTGRAYLMKPLILRAMAREGHACT